MIKKKKNSQQTRNKGNFLNLYLWKLNGGRLNTFPQKRLRTECPLSPFLFDFALEVLTNATGQVKEIKEHWLMWLSELSAGLQTKGLRVRFPVRVHAWVVGQVPTWGRARGSRSMYLSHISVSLPPFLPSFPSL